MEATAAAPGLSLQDLRNAAEVLEREAVAGGRLADTDLDARRPGTGEAYPDTSAHAWLAYALWLQERIARAPSAGERSRAQVVHEALADEPVAVRLDAGTEIRIHAKSLNALLVLEGLDADLQQVRAPLADLVAAQEDGAVDGAAVAAFVGSLLTAQAVRYFAWILAHPGPGLPFAESEPLPTPPDWTAALTGPDLERIVLAHLQVNRRDLDFLAKAFPRQGGGTAGRLPLSGFLGAQAAEDGLEPKVLLLDRSLRSVFAAAVVRAETHRQAHASARAGSDA